MAKNFSVNELIKRLIMPLCILAAISLLLVLFAGAPFYEKTLSTTSEISSDEVKMQSQDTQDTSVMNTTAGKRPPTSEGIDPQKKHSSDKQNSHTKLVRQKNNKDNIDYQANDAGDDLAAEEESRFLDKDRLVDPEGAMYTEAQLNDLDPETIRLVEEEVRLTLEYQLEVEEEFDREEMDNSIAEEVAALEEDRLVDPEGAMYTEAQLNDLDPETIRLIEEEVRLASMAIL